MNVLLWKVAMYTVDEVIHLVRSNKHTPAILSETASKSSACGTILSTVSVKPVSQRVLRATI